MIRDLSRRKFIRLASLTGFILEIASTPSLAMDGVIDGNEDEGADGLIVVFQGDSITDGNRGRNTDLNHIMGHGYAFAIASRIGADFPSAGFSFFNRGISGNRIIDLQKRWQADTIDLKPDILSILIGINDAAAEVEKWPEANPVKEFENGYRDLIQTSRSANPDVLLVLGLPFVYEVGARKDHWREWQAATYERIEVIKKLAVEFDAVLVDYPAVFDKATQKAPISYWIWDGIHPTVAGHELMAREWIKQVGKRLSFLQKKYKY